MHRKRSLRTPVPNCIYRPWRRDARTGRILWAKHYGLRAWRIPVTDPMPLDLFAGK